MRAAGSAGNSAEAIFLTEKITPPAPTLLFPQHGAKLETFHSVGDVFLRIAKYLTDIITLKGASQQRLEAPIATFNWTDVNDNGNVNYIFQIAIDGNFSSPVLVRDGLASSEYTLSKEDRLTQANYSWRVKAVDDIGKESPWSEAQEFELVPMSKQVLAISLALSLLLIAAIIAAGILTWRYRR